MNSPDASSETGGYAGTGAEAHGPAHFGGHAGNHDGAQGGGHEGGWSVRPRRRMGDAPDNPIWLISFTDVIALLLTFFVMIFAMSEPVTEHWDGLSTGVQAPEAHTSPMAQEQGALEGINLNRVNFDTALDLRYLEALLLTVIEDNQNLQDIHILRQADSLVVSLPQELLFDSGRADIKATGARALYALGGVLSRIRNHLAVVGHADPRPVEGTESPYKSNWDLSLARAAAVAGVLESVGYRRPVDIAGQSSGRYDDLGAVKDDARRLALARRVDIIIMNHAGRRKDTLFAP